MTTPVFKNADEFFHLLSRLVTRPRKGELPEDVEERDGIPVVRLVGDDQHNLAEDIGKSLLQAKPVSVPHEFIDVSTIWKDVTAEREDLVQEGEHWARAELYRRILVELAKEFSSASNRRDARVRFRRFGLVNWLLESTHDREGWDDPHDQRLLARLRDRELRRGRLWAAVRSPGGEVALQEKVPWWGWVLATYIVPTLWFRAWRLVGTEYRWLLKQPFMAPRDPGTFVGFALRLAQPRRKRENPDEVGRLMINAFLEDLHVAYRRRPWRRRAWRRTAYCVAFLIGADDENHGNAFISSLIDVRNTTGVFDPLLVMASTPRAGYTGPEPRHQPLQAYESWQFRFGQAGRSRQAEEWYLTLGIPAPLSPTDPDHDLLLERLEPARVIRLHPMPRWARRRVTVAAFAVAMALLVAGCGYTLSELDDWRYEHCGLSPFDPDAATLRRQSNGECVGIAPHGYAFAADKDLAKAIDTIVDQNAEADRIHRKHPQRPVVTLVHVSSLFRDSGVNYAREALQGVASAQRRQLDQQGGTDPVLRIFPASAGSDMRSGPTVAAMLDRMMRDDPTIVGVTGLDQSRRKTVATIHELTRIGLPMVATTLSADNLDEQSPLYFQVSPQDGREAAIAAAYARHLAELGKVQRTVRVIYSADSTDLYSPNLKDDAEKSFTAAGFRVQVKQYVPPQIRNGISQDGAQGAHAVGEGACDYPGLVFFASRSEDFAKVLEGTNRACGSHPPVFLGDDDVARFAADPRLRGEYPKIPFDFLDFTPGSASCDGASDLYSTMKDLFPTDCEKVRNTSLDGHASLAFDAVSLFLKAIGQLRDPGLPLTGSAVWHGLSGIHGKSALDGESGKIDFGGLVDQQIPTDKLISVQHIDGAKTPSQVGFCGKQGERQQSEWCPATARTD